MPDLSLRGIASGLVTVVAVLVLAAFVVQAVPALVGADASYVVLSGSMEPTISTGDAVIVESVDPADVEAGDVITFTRGDDSTPVTHRVVEVVERENGLAFRTKGDANEDPDPQPVPADNVTGEVWFVIPYIGHVVLFANTTTGLATLVGAPVVLFVLSELWAWARSGGERADDTAVADAEVAEAAATTEAIEATEAAEASEAEHAADPATGTTPGADGEGVEEDASSGITVTPADLQFSAVSFTALAAYSGYVAYSDPSPLHVSVFAAAAMVVLFVLVVLVFGEAEGADDADEVSGSRLPAEQATAAEPEPQLEADTHPEPERTPDVALDGVEDPVTDGGADGEGSLGGGDDGV